MRPEIITSTFQMADDAPLPPPQPPENVPANPTTLEHRYILIQTTQSPAVVLWSAATVTDVATCTVE